MIDETFFLNGVDAREFGIFLQEPIRISGLVPIVKAVQVPGRDGSVLFETGSFKNREAIAVCYSLYKGVSASISSATEFLLGSGGYARLELSSDPTHYLMANVSNGPDIEHRMNTLNPFTISFDCKPQMFVKNSDPPITIENPGGNIRNPHSGTSEPLIKVYGNGSGYLEISGVRVNIHEISQYMMLDCDTLNAYKLGQSQNNSITAEYFPVLKPGMNRVSMGGGIQKVEIEPRWWDK